jgi:hypothetical protein
LTFGTRADLAECERQPFADSVLPAREATFADMAAVGDGRNRHSAWCEHMGRRNYRLSFIRLTFMATKLTKQTAWRISIRLGLLLGTLTAVAILSWAGYRFWPRQLEALTPTGLPIFEMRDEGFALRVPVRHLAAQLGEYDNELFAYLMFDYLRSRELFSGRELLLTHSVRAGTIAYSIAIVLPDDLLTGLLPLIDVAREFPFLTTHWVFADERALQQQRFETETFVRAYNFPAYRKLDRLSSAEVREYARRFIRFKSVTDPRIRRQIEPVPKALTREEAKELAEDIVTVAEFFSLPLDLFLGIGAMENNYMDIKGDLGNTIWKSRPDKGDVILRRRGKRVLVLNESSGVWQITRQTLRYAHVLYLRDKRDYSSLPEHLRPPHELDVAAIDSKVLTTYAAMLFRDLLDRFGGDVEKAVGAYNGGPGNPNLRYADGVQRVAEYARRMLEQAAGLRGETGLSRGEFSRR